MRCDVEIKSLSSPDVEVDDWRPTSTEEVCFLLELEVGERGVDKRDLFQVMVATPEGLRKLTPSDGSVISDRALLVLSEFSWPLLHATLRRILDRCASRDWSETVLRLQRYFEWEYEDYV
jgi:hypothetical protein